MARRDSQISPVVSCRQRLRCSMADLPMRPDLDGLRREAQDLLRAAEAGDPAAVARVGGGSARPDLPAAQRAVARGYGFTDWAGMATEVERRAVLDSGDVPRLRAMLAERPDLSTRRMEHWCDHRPGADPLGYLAMLRFDARRLGLPAELPNVGEMARMLLAAGAPVDGPPGAAETTLMTAASYGDPEVAGILIEAGADLESTASPHAGGVPGGTALKHAAVFGMTAVVDLLVASGSPDQRPGGRGRGRRRHGPAHAAPTRRAGVRAAHRRGDERLSVIDELLPPAHRSTVSTPTVRPRCTRRPSTADRRVCGTCLPPVRTRTSATPLTAAHRWAGAATSTSSSARARGTSASRQSWPRSATKRTRGPRTDRPRRDRTRRDAVVPAECRNEPRPDRHIGEGRPAGTTGTVREFGCGRSLLSRECRCQRARSPMTPMSSLSMAGHNSVRKTPDREDGGR